MATKYTDDHAGYRALRERGAPPARPIDLSRLAGKLTLRQRLTGLVVPHVPGVLRALGSFAGRGGAPRLGGFTWITRDADVRAALRDSEAFATPYGHEMRDIAGPVSFGLGDDGALHDRHRAAMEPAFRDVDIETGVRAPARRFADILLDDSGGTFDLIGELLPATWGRVAGSMIGVDAPDPVVLANGVVAVSADIFGNPFGDKEPYDEARNAARILDPVFERAVEMALRADEDNKTILARMARDLRAQSGDPFDDLDDGEGKPRPYAQSDLRADLKACAFGMTVGFAASQRFAAGAMTTLSKKGRMDDAMALAREIVDLRRLGAPDGDAVARFDRMVLEGARFRPSLDPGQFRIRTGDPGGRDLPEHLRAIPEGETVIVSTAAAMMDPRGNPHGCPHPRRFAPERHARREDGQTLAFGYGRHHCLGAPHALAAVSEVLIAALSRPGARFPGGRAKVRYAGAVPLALPMAFTPTTGQLRQTQIMAALPLAHGTTRDWALEVCRRVEAESHYARILHDSGIVHFASLNVVELGKRGRETSHLLVEINVDGEADAALERISREDARNGNRATGPLLKLVAGARDVDRSTGMTPFLAAVAAKRSPRSRNILRHNGLDFVGTGEFSVRQIERERALARRLDEALSEKLWEKAEKNPDKTLHIATRIIFAARESLGEEFADLMVRLPSRGLRFAQGDTVPYATFVSRYLAQPWLGAAAGGVLAATLVALVWALLARGGWSGFETYVTFALVPVLLLATLAAIAVWFFRRAEAREVPDARTAEPARLRALVDSDERTAAVGRGEGRPAQSHITTVSTFKPGLLRRATFAIAMHVVAAQAKLWFRPGFLTDFATIHYARWVRIRGTDQMIFQSNFDGSWESYLEDFITKVHQGQTLAWSNAEGFPASRWPTQGGAHNGEDFKRWVRLQQVETPFWFSRFPDLTIPQIHNNALIRDGLSRARDVGEHRAWLRLFGSKPRRGATLETDEIQTLVFRGHGRFEHSLCLPLRITNPDAARKWLAGQLGDTRNAETLANARRGPAAAAHTGKGPAPSVLRLHFGDHEPVGGAFYLAFSAGGLVRMTGDGTDVPLPTAPLPTAPMPFREGMHRRKAVLGDPALDWSGSGGDDVSGAHVVGHAKEPVLADAVVLAYGAGDEGGDAIGRFMRTLAASGLKSIDRAIDTSRHPDRPATLGGFGFHEGASQPVIRGTAAAASREVAPRDLVAPGEFVLGYADTRGNEVSPLAVAPDPAALRHLPHVAPSDEDAYPHFGDPANGHLFDLGRNGSFLALRQIRHDENAFADFVTRESQRLNAWMARDREMSTRGHAQGHGYLTLSAPRPFGDGAKALGVTDWVGGDGEVSFDEALARDFIAAKMVGRWRDGSSLVRHPSMSATAQRRIRSFRSVMRATERLASAPPSGERKLDAARTRLLKKYRSSTQAGSIVTDLVWRDADWDEFVRMAQAARLGGGDLQPAAVQASAVDNDFLYDRDDPQGLRCPIGAHIRRTNPRDTPSSAPGAPDALEIVNRHRLLRRGRPYRDGSVDGGTLFVCLNADLERQFEFVQRTWLNSRHFQGLTDEPDPIAAPHGVRDRFTIPAARAVIDLRYADRNPVGSDETGGGEEAPEIAQFTEVVGGGYFLLPSRAALCYLAVPRT